MRATSCKACVVMDNTTLREPEVENRMEEYVKIKYRADAASDVTDYFDVIGLPTYVVLQPKE